MKKLLTLAIALTFAATGFAKSVVFQLNDAASTRVYYKLSTPGPKMVIGKDGSFTINDRQYLFSDVNKFYFTDTDYSGETGTEDGLASGIAIITADGNLQMSGKVKVYGMDGKLIKTADSKEISLDGLNQGTYIITNGTSTVKIHKK